VVNGKRARGRAGTGIALSARGAPLYEQIYTALRDAIVGGSLKGGARVASTRALAAELSVSRFTAVTAVERLLAEGYLTSRARSGLFVAQALPEERMRAAPPRGARTTNAGGRSPSLSRRGAALSAVVITGPRGIDEPRPFHPRRPALDAFPVRLWTRLLTRHWRTGSAAALDYGDPAGYAPLREAIAEHISVSRGLRCGAHQVVVTSGAQQAFDMLFRILLDPGDEVWMEDPGYLDVRAALVGAGAAIVPVPVTDSGLDVDEGIRRAPHARLAIVSPSHQYPSGATLTAPRRAALIEWARRAGAWIVEDDYDCFFRYRGRPLPALQRFDADSAHGGAARVIYVGTFSKTMFPSLRLGFCVVPETIVDAAANARAVASRNAPLADQAALASFIADGHYDRHLRRARLIYQERHEAMRASFARELGGVLSLAPAAAGTHVIARFAPRRRGAPDPSAAVRIERAAAAERLVAFPLSRYCLEPPLEDALVLGYGAITPRRIAGGAAKLSRVIARTLR
jgi:GntR family transcriptional regulator/MocR family aminotransferase